MAWTKVECRNCKSEFEVQLYGPIRDREWKVKHWNWLCEDCKAKQREEEAKEAAKKSQEMELPELIGSEKQIQWALKIRRTRVAKESVEVKKHLKGYVPITIIRSAQADRKNRMAATIRHNRARGIHGVAPMIDLVASLIRDGWSDEEVAKELGMDADEVLRFKQHTGLPEPFKDHQFSRAWE